MRGYGVRQDERGYSERLDLRLCESAEGHQGESVGLDRGCDACEYCRHRCGCVCDEECHVINLCFVIDYLIMEGTW